MGNNQVVPVMVPTEKGEWIKYVLQGNKEIARKVGDFDRDGIVGTVKDYTDYYTKYKHVVDRLPFFKAASSFDRVVKGGGKDLVHNLMSIATDALKPQEIVKAYAHLEKAYRSAEVALKRCTTDGQRAQELIKAIGSQFRVLTKGVKRNRMVFDEAAIFAAALAKQMDLKGITAVIGPRDKVYLGYKKGIEKWYVDSKGQRVREGELKSMVSSRVVDGVYLKPLNQNELVGMMMLNRGYISLKAASAGSKKSEKMHNLWSALIDYGSSLLFIHKSPLVWKSMGNAFYFMKDKTQTTRQLAGLFYGVALGFDEGYAPALNNLGNLVRGALSKMVYYRAAVLYEPEFPQGHYNLCNTLGEIGRVEEAIPHCTAATRYKVTAAVAFYARANATLSVRWCGKTSTSDGLFIKDLYRAIEADPSSIPSALRLMSEYAARSSAIAKRDYELAKTFLKEALVRASKTGTKSQVYTVMGLLHRAMGKGSQAIDAFKKAIALDLKNWRAYQNWAKIYLYDTKEYEKGMEKLDEVVAMGFKSGGIFFVRGLAQIFQKKYMAAFPDLIEAVKLDRDYAYKAFSAVAFCMDKKYYRPDQLPQVRAFLDLVIKADPKNSPAYYYYRAKASILMGDLASWWGDARKASEKRPKLSPYEGLK